jgi:ATP-dependent Clp protease ATP-binding subunit ClpA
MREVVDRELRRHFPPEFINRLDDVIVFDALDEDSMLEIARLMLDETSDLLRPKNVRIEFDAAVAGWLLEQCGRDPQAGARPLRRLVKQWVEDAVADYLIQHQGEEISNLLVRLSGGRPIVDAAGTVAERGKGR